MASSYILVYQNHRVVLPDGVVFVGRAIDCHVRFNAPTVSRHHLKLELEDGVLRAENMSTTTGTLLNGKPMSRVSTLRDGDRLSLGPRELYVELVDDVGPTAWAEIGLDGDSGIFGDDDTRDSVLADMFVDPPPQIDFHTCPSCRERVSFDRSTCPTCGHTWDPFVPSAVTQRTTMKQMPPMPPPPPAEVPVVYASEEMTIDAVAREIRPDGLFVPTELLDPEGTECDLTILADGEAALVVRGVVAAVRSSAGASAPGLDIRFTEVGPAARAWLAARRR